MHNTPIEPMNAENVKEFYVWIYAVSEVANLHTNSHGMLTTATLLRVQN
jgi:hypothetical protein